MRLGGKARRTRGNSRQRLTPELVPVRREEIAEGSSRPVYSIGAVARMLRVEVATLRSWEERYGVVVPIRGKGSQRIFSRDDVDRLSYVVRSMAEGATAAEAHRLLQDQMLLQKRSPAPGAEVAVMILLADRDPFASELAEFFLRTEGYDVTATCSVSEATAQLSQMTPALAIVDLITPGGLELCLSLATVEGMSVIAVSALNQRDEALDAGASAFIEKPLSQLLLVSTVRDLLGTSALLQREW